MRNVPEDSKSSGTPLTERQTSNLKCFLKLAECTWSFNYGQPRGNLRYNKIYTLSNTTILYSSFTNKYTFIKTLIRIYIEVMWLLHVSVYDHHQGACN